jgi:hypothetical protein
MKPYTTLSSTWRVLSSFWILGGRIKVGPLEENLTTNIAQIASDAATHLVLLPFVQLRQLSTRPARVSSHFLFCSSRVSTCERNVTVCTKE